MKRTIAVLALLCVLVLCACTSQEAAPTTTVAPTTTAAPTTEPTTEPTTVPTTVAPTTEPQPQFRHPITGVPIYEPVTVRPVALVTNNMKQAQPHHGTSQADMLIEITTEGPTITRCLAFYTDLANVPALGAIRSARTYFQSLSKAYDSILVHCGDSIHANREFKSGRYPHIDSMFYSQFYRDQNRLNSGYDLEHTLFVKGEKLLELVNEQFEMETDRTDYGFTFNDNLVMEGESAQHVNIYFTNNGKLTELNYNAEKNAYSLAQFGKDYVDGNNDELVHFSNVFVLRALSSFNSTTGHAFHTLTGTNEGYYISGGKIRPITWTRATEDDPFTFTYEDGTTVELTPGTIYMAVIRTKGVVEYE